MRIDMHHHLIYGVDDGAKTFEGTQKMALDAVRNGVEAIITTPHITPGVEPFDYDAYMGHLEETRQWMAQDGIDIALYTGSEILYTHATPYMLSEGRIPTLAGTRYALVEFSPDDTFKYLLESGESIANQGFVPVYAHVERYESLKKPEQVRKLRRECGALIQVNARTVIRRQGFLRQRYLERIIDDELVDFVSTDCHDMPGRENHMAETYEKLAQEYGEDLALALTGGNVWDIILSELVTNP